MKLVNQLFSLEDRVIVVAGGAGQIGFSFCTALADAGAIVIIADVDDEMGRMKIASSPPEMSGRIHLRKLDVSQPAEIAPFFAEVRRQFKGLYGLINCFHFKGNTRKLDTSSSFFAEFGSYPPEAWDIVHNVNLRGSFLMSQASLPYLKENRNSVIVNVSSTYGNVSPNKSIYGDSGINSPVAYATSKAAIINLTRYMATHLSEFGVRVNTLSPGGVINNQSEDFIRNYINLTPLGRMAEPDDYQGAILFLMSDASRYMTGSNLIVDGGWTAW